MRVPVKIEIRKRVDERGKDHPETCGTCTRCEHAILRDGVPTHTVAEMLEWFENHCPQAQLNYYVEQT